LAQQAKTESGTTTSAAKVITDTVPVAKKACTFATTESLLAGFRRDVEKWS
jgi:hypothetical protein